MNKPEWGSRRTLSTGTVIEYSERDWLGGVTIRPDDRWECIDTVDSEWNEMLGQSFYYLSNDHLDLEEYSGKLLPLLPPPSMLSADRDTRIVEAWECLSVLFDDEYDGDSPATQGRFIFPTGSDTPAFAWLFVRRYVNGLHVEIDCDPERTGDTTASYEMWPALETALGKAKVLQAWLAEVQKGE